MTWHRNSGPWNIECRLEPVDYGEYADSDDELPV
jgi:hypothetical protein